MKQFPFAIIFVIGFVFSAAPQTPTPRPSPPDAEVVKISTNLIQLDISVTDKKGKPITDIKAHEIEIYENGEKQKITSFSFVSGERRSTQTQLTKDNVPYLPPSTLRPEQVRRSMAVVVDDLSLTFSSAYYTRRALKRFVDEQMQDGDLVAIIRTGAGIGALQQFSSDKHMLQAAIDKVKWNPMGMGDITAFAPMEQDTSRHRPDRIESETSPSGGDDIDEFRGSVFATGTLGALRYVVSGMSDLPGRKSVILFSQGFSMFGKEPGDLKRSGSVGDFLRTLIDLANRSSVVFYAVDPRGLTATAYLRELNETQDGLRYLTNGTGGFAVINNNDLSSGVRRVLDDQSYYLVGYEPDSDTFDPTRRRFNQIEAKVLRKDLDIRYRSGFFNVVDKAPPAIASTSDTPAFQLHSALVSPFAVNGINIRLNALFGSDTKDQPFVRSVLHVNAGDLKFVDDEGGSKKAVFDILAMSFGDNGQIADRLWKTYTMTIKPDAYKRMAADGFVYHFTFPVKQPGAYQYRVAIRDTQTGRIGSASQFIEVPNLKKKRLTASSIVLEALSPDEWRRSAEVDIPSSQLADTALRRVRAGSALKYGIEIYNARLDPRNQPKLTTRVRVFYDGKPMFDGDQIPFEMLGQTDLKHLNVTGAMAIGKEMPLGDYVLQVIITDELAKKKQQIVTQFVQFEVVQK